MINREALSVHMINREAFKEGIYFRLKWFLLFHFELTAVSL